MVLVQESSMTDYDTATATAYNAGYASAFNVRNRIVGGIQPRNTFFSSRTVWDACINYPYLTRYNRGFSSGLDPDCGTVLSVVGFEAAIIGVNHWRAWDLPDGMSIAQITGDLIGTPTELGDFPFTVNGS